MQVVLFIYLAIHNNANVNKLCRNALLIYTIVYVFPTVMQYQACLPRLYPPRNLHLASSEQWCWSGGRGILTELSLCYSIV